jgi:hypothetical protein
VPPSLTVFFRLQSAILARPELQQQLEDSLRLVTQLPLAKKCNVPERETETGLGALA